jgi:hypothetical protein
MRRSAKHRIKIRVQALDIQRMRDLVRAVDSRSNEKRRDSNWSWRAIRAALADGQEMPTPQGFPASRILSTARFVMARLAESA